MQTYNHSDDLPLTSGEAGKIHLPPYKTTQILKRRANSQRPFIHFLSLATNALDIEKALIKIDYVASNQEGIAARYLIWVSDEIMRLFFLLTVRSFELFHA